MKPYNIFDHGTGVRVVEFRSGGREEIRRGLVYRIDETSPEWIEPLILWDKRPNEISDLDYAKGLLVLEDESVKS